MTQLRTLNVVVVVAIFYVLTQTALADSLGIAVGNTELTWTTGGDADWFYQTSNDAAQSGAISDNQRTWISTTVDGPGILSFRWAVSSEYNSDFLSFYIDGTLEKSISGYLDWSGESYDINQGTHTLKWEYSKDGSLYYGSDAGWLHNVEFVSYGNIDISSSPSGADIYLDNTYKGTTPQTIYDVPAGSHIIELRKLNYNDKEITVTVAAGETKNVDESLIIETGSISVGSDPDGAEVYLDDAYKGITPITISYAPIGEHTIKLSKLNYNDKEITVTVAAGETKNVYESLIIETGSISVGSDPDGAEVYLDDAYKGITPITISYVPVGEHTIKISKINYYDIEERVTVTADQRTDFSRYLKHQIGSVEISADPAGASIYLDGTYEGTTPATLTSVPTGSYYLVLKKFGYADYSQNIQIIVGKTTEVVPSMKLALPIELLTGGIVVFFIIGLISVFRGKKQKSKETTQVSIPSIEPEPIKVESNYKTIGTILKGEYRIIKLLKVGGMGSIYLGEYNGDKCIIKQPKTVAKLKESNYFLKTIKIEAEILSKLNHDNIVGYIDSFEENNSFYLIEKYVEGEKLGDKYLNNPGNEDEVIYYTFQLLSAVEYLHKKQIKHRDINPNNLILTPDKKIVLIDFGTAKYFNTEKKEIKSMPKSTKIGTPYYAPPEQWEGDTSAASDIFSIGRTIYFMLTGENPTENPYKKLDFQGKNVRNELADFVIKAAEPEINDRYKSAIEMIYYLKTIKVNETIL